MRVSNTNEKDRALAFVLPPLLAQHELPASIAAGKRAAVRSEGSCNNSTPRTLNNCFYRTRGPLSPE
ncbi:MAG: hypothetical protein ACT4P3_21840 [Betaproteobacteria bacterium]